MGAGVAVGRNTPPRRWGIASTGCVCVNTEEYDDEPHQPHSHVRSHRAGSGVWFSSIPLIFFFPPYPNSSRHRRAFKYFNFSLPSARLQRISESAPAGFDIAPPEHFLANS